MIADFWNSSQTLKFSQVLEFYLFSNIFAELWNVCKIPGCFEISLKLEEMLDIITSLGF